MLFDPSRGSHLLRNTDISTYMSTLRVEEAEINEMVYRLYGLTDEEKQIVENG